MQIKEIAINKARKNKGIFVVIEGKPDNHFFPIAWLRKPKGITDQQWEIIQNNLYFSISKKKLNEELKKINELTVS